MRRFATIVGLLVMAGPLPARDQPRGVSNLPEVTAAWQKAGARIGRLGRDRDDDRTVFDLPGERHWKGTPNLDESTVVPVFEVHGWPASRFDERPVPNRAFAISLIECPIDRDGLKSLLRFRQLVGIHFGRTNVPPSALVQLAALPELRVVLYQDTPIADRPRPTAEHYDFTGFHKLTDLRVGGRFDFDLADLDSLKSCRLESLTLQRVPLSPVLMASLARHAALRHLTVQGTDRLTGTTATPLPVRLKSLTIACRELRSLKPFGDLSELDAFQMTYADAGDDLLRELGNCRKIRVLNLGYGNRLTGTGLRHLPEPSSLRSLNVAGSAFDETGCRELARLTGLETLNLTMTKIGDGGLASLKPLTRLRELHLGANAIGDDGATHLAPLKSLRKLSLARTRIGDESLKLIAHWPELSSLNLGETKATDAGMGHLTAGRKLEFLGLDKTAITDRGLEPIGQIATLASLSLRFANVTSAGLAHLRNLPRLETLDLPCTNVDDASVPLLLEMPALRYVGLGETKLSDDAIETLRKRRPACTFDSYFAG